MYDIKDVPTVKPSTTLMKIEVNVNKESLRKAIEEAELTLVAEPRKGKWIKGIGENGVTTSLYCNQCGYENGHWYEWNFCPNCGTKMEKSE